MPSRLLSDLEARIAAAARDPVQSACLRAERATVLARQGRLDEARAELELIRTRHAATPDALITAWVCLGEGMVVLYTNLGPSSRDKILRAHALASACGEHRVRCLSAAWLAHFSYLDQDFSAMARSVAIALREAGAGDHLTLERACLVVAQAYHWSDRFDLARPWYERARLHAVSAGDETAVSALMHNMAWLHVAQERRRALAEHMRPERASRLLLGAESVESFDRRIGTASLTALVPILRAHVLSLLDRHQEACELFEAHLADSLAQGLSTIECSMLAELAWCQVNCGREHDARSTMLASEKALERCTQSDERGATYGRLAQCFDKFGNTSSAGLHTRQAMLEWKRNLALQEAALSALAISEIVGSNAHSRPGAPNEPMRNERSN